MATRHRGNMTTNSDVSWLLTVREISRLQPQVAKHGKPWLRFRCLRASTGTFGPSTGTFGPGESPEQRATLVLLLVRSTQTTTKDHTKRASVYV